MPRVPQHPPDEMPDEGATTGTSHHARLQARASASAANSYAPALDEDQASGVTIGARLLLCQCGRLDGPTVSTQPRETLGVACECVRECARPGPSWYRSSNALVPAALRRRRRAPRRPVAAASPSGACELGCRARRSSRRAVTHGVARAVEREPSRPWPADQLASLCAFLNASKEP